MAPGGGVDVGGGVAAPVALQDLLNSLEELRRCLDGCRGGGGPMWW